VSTLYLVLVYSSQLIVNYSAYIQKLHILQVFYVGEVCTHVGRNIFILELALSNTSTLCRFACEANFCVLTSVRITLYGLYVCTCVCVHHSVGCTVY